MAHPHGIGPWLDRHARLIRRLADIVSGLCARLPKVIKRMAYGYRDSEYFFLKIKAAFPGNP